MELLAIRYVSVLFSLPSVSASPARPACLPAAFWLSWMAVEVVAAVVFTLLLIAFGAMFQFQFFLKNSFFLVRTRCPAVTRRSWALGFYICTGSAQAVHRQGRQQRAGRSAC